MWERGRARSLCNMECFDVPSNQVKPDPRQNASWTLANRSKTLTDLVLAVVTVILWDILHQSQLKYPIITSKMRPC